MTVASERWSSSPIRCGRAALGEQPQDLALAIGQRRSVGRLAELDLGGDPGRELRRDHGLAAPGRDDRLAELGVVGRLRDVSGGALGQRLVGGAGVLVAGQQHHLRPQAVALDGADDLEPVESGHPDVDDRHVRLELVDPLERLAPVGARADELEVGPLADRALETLPVDGMIVRDQDRQPPGAHRRDSGTAGGGFRADRGGQPNGWRAVQPRDHPARVIKSPDPAADRAGRHGCIPSPTRGERNG